MRIRSSIARYLIGAAVVGAAAAVRYLLEQSFGDVGTFALFYTAVLVAAFAGGLGPGLFATGLAAVTVGVMFSGANIKPSTSAAIALRQSIFIGTGGVMSWFVASHRRAEDKAARALGDLSLERERARVTLSSIGDAVIATDAQGRVTFLNDAAAELLGWPEQEAIGKPIDDVFRVVHADTREPVESPFTRVLRSGAGVALTEPTAVLTRDSTPVPIDDSGAPIRDGDAVVGVVLVFRDIRDRKTAELERQSLLNKERAARAEAERMVRTKDEFLATLSHELRTPLNAILGWAQLLRAGTMPAKDVGRGLEVIERNARAQARLVEDLLDMSRIISGKARLDVRPVDVVSVVSAAMEAVLPAAQAKSIRVTKSVEPGASRANADRARLQQVIWNLLSNSIKFTPSGGSVEISVKRADGAIEIGVTDTGQGIAPEFLPHVFEHFRQADSSVTRNHSGLGLGLAIARHLIELHGGTIRAESEGSGRGAAFTVRLPAGTEPLRERTPISEGPPASEPSAPLLAYTPPPLDGVKVLFVDDDQDARDLGMHILAEHKAEVIPAASAAEALAAVKRERPTVIVSDIGMPGEDGYSLIGKVRALGDDGGGGTPAVALTAFAHPDDRRRALLAGFQVHLPKPVDPVELVAAVAALAGRTGKMARPRSA